MTEWVWLNGTVTPLSDAKVSIEDRGYQFADGVYEVIRIYNGKPFTLKEHLDRLYRSAKDIQIALSIDQPTLTREINALIAKAALKDAMVYLQATRGTCARNHLYPESACKPTILFYVRQLPPPPVIGQIEGVKLITLPDERWKRCWIKSIALLPNVLAKNAAVSAGADEAVFIDDNGQITECSVSNFYALIKGALVTHPVGPKVLPGITRLVVLDCARQLGIPVQERAMTESEALSADEIFITSTTREIGWVSHWNNKQIAQHAGPLTDRLHHALRQRVTQETGYESPAPRQRRPEPAAT
jgi:D-alanine transaminase